MLFIGCDVNLANSDGNTPLSLACSLGNDVIVELLLQHPTVDVDQGLVRTPLHEAATVGSTTIIQRLISAGCNVNKVRARFYVSYTLQFCILQPLSDLCMLEISTKLRT